MFKLLTLASCLLLGSVAFAKADGAALYFVKVDTAGFAYEMLVNDIPVFAQRQGGQVIVSVPVNQYLVDGKNQLTIRPLEVVTDKARGKFTVLRNAETVKAFEPSIKRDHVEKALELPFALTLPFKAGAWTKGQTITRDVATLKSLAREYRRLNGLLAAKDVKRYLDAMEERNRELGASYFETYESRVEEQRGELEDLLKSWKLKPFPTDAEIDKLAGDPQKDPFVLSVLANGKLARLETKKKNSPLSFLDQSGKLASYLPLMFYKNGKGAWVAIR